MKTKLLFLSLLAGFQLHAQQILNIYSVPANPTTADVVTILVDCQFTSGSCNTHTQGQSFTTTTHVDAWALQCLGALSVICNYTDTFTLGLLAAGNYSFTFQLDEGHGLPTCTPGIAPGPNDTYNFTISVATAENEIEKNDFSIYPNPAINELRIQNGEFKIEAVRVYNVVGKEVLSQRLTADSQQQATIDISALPPGMYIAELRAGEKLSRKIFSVQR